ncbi:MAG: extracellular solute-binding protein [Lachnospiraceae bacterium]|nr:extracellular solute-binding protein [Lachnospiraceae bacterium]
MKMKKVMAVALSLSMAMSLVACGGNAGSGSSDAGSSDSGSADAGSSDAGSSDAGSESGGAKQTDGKNVPELTTDDMTITLWDIATEEPNKSTQEAAVARFMKDYPNIHVEQIHQQNDNYKQQLVVAMSSGKCPDMYISWGGGPMAEYYKSGFADDITDLFNKYDHPDFIDAAVAQGTYDGKVIGIPFGSLSGCDVFYNKTIFAENGLEVPETLDELEAVCEKLKAAGITPFALANAPKWTGSMYYMYLVARHSGNEEFDAAYTQDGGSFTSEAFLFASDKIQDWVKKGYFPDGVNSLSPDDGQDKQLLYDGSAAMMLHGSWMAGSMAADSQEWYDENIDVFRWPEDAEAKAKGVPQDVEIGTAIGNAFNFCSKGDQAKLEAMYVLATQYFNDDQYNKEQMEHLNTPSIKGYDAQVTDPCMKKITEVFFNASNVQLWYDQYLPASVTEVHKESMSALFGLEKDGKQIGEDQDKAMQEAIADSK